MGQQPGLRADANGDCRVPGPIALLVAVALAAACASSPPASPARGASPAPATSASSPANGLAWTEGTVEQAAGPDATSPGPVPVFCSPCHAAQETSLAGVTAGRSVFVAVGMQFPPPQAAAWFSVDGTRWQRAGTVDAPAGSLMNAVASVAQGFVAVGGAGANAAAWISPDGRAWTRAGVETPPEPGTARMDAVAPTSGGLVAAGDVETAPSGGRAVVWRSPDGRHWATAAESSSFAGATIAGIAASRTLVVAVGSVTATDGRHSAATWWSPDGRTWSPGATDPSFADAQLLAVTTGGPGFVAVGTSDGGLRAAAWTSTDGVHWTASPGGPGFTNYGQRIEMTAVTRVGAGFVAGGKRDSAGNGSSVVWVSSDGISWRRVPDTAGFEGAEMTGVTARGAGVVAVGARGIPDNWASAAWVGPSTGP